MSRRSREEARQQEKEAKSRRALKERAYQETQRSVYARIYQEQDAMPDDYEGIVREIRCAFGCGSAMVELYTD